MRPISRPDRRVDDVVLAAAVVVAVEVTEGDELAVEKHSRRRRALHTELVSRVRLRMPNVVWVWEEDSCSARGGVAHPQHHQGHCRLYQEARGAWGQI